MRGYDGIPHYSHFYNRPAIYNIYIYSLRNNFTTHNTLCSFSNHKLGYKPVVFLLNMSKSYIYIFQLTPSFVNFFNELIYQLNSRRVPLYPSCFSFLARKLLSSILNVIIKNSSIESNEPRNFLKTPNNNPPTTEKSRQKVISIREIKEYPLKMKNQNLR